MARRSGRVGDAGVEYTSGHPSGEKNVGMEMSRQEGEE